MMNRPTEIRVGTAVLKYREPENLERVRVGILLHGWTGDESSMWVFGNKLDSNWLLIAPRAPFPTVDTGLGGYSWADQSIHQWPAYQEFFPAVNYMSELIQNLSHTFKYADFSKFSLMGFSQGAAMALVFAGAHVKNIQKLIMLSGFVPEGYEGYINSELFEQVEIFIGHGNQDDVVPVRYAVEAKNIFEGHSKALVYCATDVGHRLGADCFKALQKFTNE